MAQISKIGAKANPPMPGKLLKRMLLDELHLTQAQVAEAIGVSRPRLSMIFKGRCVISPEIALRLEKVFGISPDRLLRVRAEYDLFVERQRISRELERLSQVHATAELQRNFWSGHLWKAAA